MRAKVNGITLGYEEQGTGIPLVFLHAFPFNRTMWRPQEGLASRHRMLAIDLRGHGESDAPFWRYSLEQYARDVKELLAHLGIHKAIFVGLSMGGYLSFTLYRCYPELVLGLALADTRAEADKPEQLQWRFDLAQRAAAQGPSAVVTDMLPKLLSPKTYRQRPHLVKQVQSIQETAPVQVIIGDLMAMAERPDSISLLTSIAVPVVVLAGEDDVLTPPADAERIAKGIPGATLVIIPEAGHMSNIEQPDAFNHAVGELAARCSEITSTPRHRRD